MKEILFLVIFLCLINFAYALDETPFWMYIIYVIVFILAAVAGYLVFLLVKKNMPEMPKQEKEEVIEEEKCFICGKSLKDYEYTCSKCGQKTCYNHMRTYEKKYVCVNCLKKMGLI